MWSIYNLISEYCIYEGYYLVCFVLLIILLSHALLPCLTKFTIFYLLGSETIYILLLCIFYISGTDLDLCSTISNNILIYLLTFAHFIISLILIIFFSYLFFWLCYLSKWANILLTNYIISTYLILSLIFSILLHARHVEINMYSTSLLYKLFWLLKS
jgi:hypothetical protein